MSAPIGSGSKPLPEEKDQKPVQQKKSSCEGRSWSCDWFDGYDNKTLAIAAAALAAVAGALYYFRAQVVAKSLAVKAIAVANPIPTLAIIGTTALVALGVYFYKNAPESEASKV